MQFKMIKNESLYSGFFNFDKYYLSNQLFNGEWSNTYTREVLDRGHAAAVLLYDQNRDKLVFVEQFRPGAIATEKSPWIIELVAGMIEKGEQPEAVVRRESLEESGSKILNLRKICEYLVSPGGSTERIWLYLGEIDSREVAEFAGLEDENEDIKVHCVSTNTAFKWLECGRINNAMTIIAIQWLQLNLPNQSKLWA